MTSRPIDLYRDAMQKVVDDVFAKMMGEKQEDWYVKGMRKLQEMENAIVFPSLLGGKRNEHLTRHS